MLANVRIWLNLEGHYLVKISKAARMMDVNVVTLKRWHEKGLIKLVKLPNGRIAMPKDEIERISRNYLEK
jgi:predicted site-specific integrase-resolvase